MSVHILGYTSPHFQLKMVVVYECLCGNCLCLTAPCYHPKGFVTKAMPLLGERMEEISKAENVEQLFWILSDYWSWYNKDLLEKLVKEFGDREDQDRLREYNKEYTAFLKKRLPKSHDHFSFGPGHGKGQKPLLIKVDEIWEAISLGQIRGLHHNIAEILGVPPTLVDLRDLLYVGM